MPVTVTDQTLTAPLANPSPTANEPRYVSGFGLDNSFTIFFEDRADASQLYYVQTTTGPSGFPASATRTNIADTHFVIKDWPITVGATTYAYRGWGSVGNDPNHKFYVSNDLTNWTLVSTFQVPNAAGWSGSGGCYVYYGWHDVIKINGTYYAFGESNCSHTFLVRSANGDDVWEAFDSVGGIPGYGPLELPSGVTDGWTPRGNFIDLGYDRGYGKLYVDPRDNNFYLAVNTAAKASLTPAALEAAFINPDNWTWHDGTTGPAANPVLSATAEHDLRECWVVPNSNPDADWVIIYDADFGSSDGDKALGWATLNAPDGPVVYVENLEPSWTAPGGGGVFSAYIGPPDYGYVSPGTTELYDGREAGIIKAGLNAKPDGHYDDEGLFGFKPTVTIDELAAGTLTYDVENEEGTNPVWMTIEVDTGVVGDRSDNTTYQHVPTSNPAGWHTVDAGAGQWQKWNNDDGDTSGNPLISLSDVAAAHTGCNVVRAYLRLGMGDSYHGSGAGTVGWVDKATLGGVTYDFVLAGYWKNLRTGIYNDLAGSLAAALSGDTIQGVCSGSTPIPGGGTANIANVTIDLHACVVGPGSSFLTVSADDVTVLGPGILDGAGSADPAIVVKAGADNFMLQGVEIKRWSDGVFLEGSVISFKMAENFIHNNSNAGLRVGTGATLGGIATIEGNLFKDNTGVGVQNDGATDPLPATYNSWGDLAGPTGTLGDGVGTKVSYIPWTFAEIFLDMKPETEAVVHHVLETTGFDVKLKADAAKLYGLTFVFTYDTAKLTLGTTTFAAPWAGRCAVVPGLPAGTIGYFCNLLNEVPADPEWDADGGTIATFHFTAFSGTPGNGPWPALFDISHLETDTSASAIGGQKVFVNNAGFNAPTIPQRDITDTEDGRIVIERGANYTGFVDLQGRLSDSLAWCRAYNQATIAGATKLAEGSSASSGAYTTAWVSPNWLGIGNTYYVVVDRWLFLSTTAYAATSFGHSRILDAYPLTVLPNLYLLGGDATNDERILVNDLSCIGGDYGKTSGFNVCGGSGLSDVNEDGRVNVQDLSLAGGNLYKTFSPWTVP